MRNLLTMLVLMPFMALATTWYVDGTNGSDSYSGKSQSLAKKTIQSAIDASKTGDTIMVGMGTYAPIKTDNKDITIKSSSGPLQTVIDGAGSSRCACLGTDTGDGNWNTNRWSTKLIGFTLQNGYVRDSDSGNGDGAAIVGGTVSECIIKNCDGARSIVFAEEISNSLIFGNKSGWSILMHGGARNCTIVNNDADDCAWDHGLYNCIVNGNSGGVYISYGNTGAYCHNCVFDKSLPRGTGNIIADPKFIDAANDDYRVASDSPCVDAGDNSYASGTKDLDGNARIVNGVIDIGCYEYKSSPVAIYVDVASGSDSNSGLSKETAKKTIQAAVDIANVGDIVLVAPGTYAPIKTDNKDITIKSGCKEIFMHRSRSAGHLR